MKSQAYTPMEKNAACAFRTASLQYDLVEVYFLPAAKRCSIRGIRNNRQRDFRRLPSDAVLVGCYNGKTATGEVIADIRTVTQP